jgi:hypothetical protein
LVLGVKGIRNIMKGYRMSMEAKNKIEKKFKEKRIQRIAFLEQQLRIFKADLERFESQIEEIKKLE